MTDKGFSLVCLNGSFDLCLICLAVIVLCNRSCPTVFTVDCASAFLCPSNCKNGVDTEELPRTLKSMVGFGSHAKIQC